MTEYSNDGYLKALGITCIAGLATIVGASFIFCIKTNRLKKSRSLSLLFSAGVIVYLTFMHLCL